MVTQRKILLLTSMKNAGHVAIATEMYNTKSRILSLRLLKRTQSDECEVHKSQHLVERNPAPHLKHSVSTSHHTGSYGQGIKLMKHFVCWCTVANLAAVTEGKGKGCRGAGRSVNTAPQLVSSSVSQISSQRDR